MLPTPSVPIKRLLTPSDLRAALTECFAKHDSGQLSALDGTADDRLTATFAGIGNLEFNQCMSAKGWLSVPDVLLAP